MLHEIKQSLETLGSQSDLFRPSAQHVTAWFDRIVPKTVDDSTSVHRSPPSEFDNGFRLYPRSSFIPTGLVLWTQIEFTHPASAKLFQFLSVAACSAFHRLSPPSQLLCYWEFGQEAMDMEYLWRREAFEGMDG
jgi:hypothetical protein